VNPDRIEAKVGGLSGILDGLADLTPGGKPESNPADDACHLL